MEFMLRRLLSWMLKKASGEYDKERTLMGNKIEPKIK